MSVQLPEDDRREFKVRCSCGHRWIAAYAPMELTAFGKLLKGLHCPKCGGSEKTIFVDDTKDAA